MNPRVIRDDEFPLTNARYGGGVNIVGAQNGNYILGPFTADDVSEYVKISASGIFGGASVSVKRTVDGNKANLIDPNGGAATWTAPAMIEISSLKGCYVSFAVTNASSTTKIELKVVPTT
jgi:hypothetical protein